MLNTSIVRFTLLISCLFIEPSLVLADEDTGRRLWYNVQRNLQDQEKALVTDETVDKKNGSFIDSP